MIKRLEGAGVIESYVTLVNREAVGFDMLCFVQVTLARHRPQAAARFRTEVRRIPEILECFHITGEYDYLLKVVVRNRKHLERFLMERFITGSAVLVGEPRQRGQHIVLNNPKIKSVF